MDYRFSEWPDDTSPSTIIEAATVSCVLSMRDKHDSISWIHGATTARIKFLMENPGYFNCFNALRLATGRTKEMRWESFMMEYGRKMFVHDAIAQFPFPFVFQICGNVKPGFASPIAHEVIHAGLIVGKDPEGNPVVFDKLCAREPKIHSWFEVEKEYFGKPLEDVWPEYVTFFPLEELPFDTDFDPGEF